MSSTYAGTETFAATITIPDDGDPANAASVNAPLEGLADRTVWLREAMKSPAMIACGAMGFVSAAGRFSSEFAHLNLVTATAVNDSCRLRLSLIHGATVASIDMFFQPISAGRAGNLPTVAVSMALQRSAVTAGVALAALPTTITNASYVPVSYANYINGQVKMHTISPAHVVDAEAYEYFLLITDEGNPDALVGNKYIAYRVNYA
jgi:hypothetical protein